MNEKVFGIAQLLSLLSTDSNGFPFSRRHSIDGDGEPVAAQVNVTFSPS